MKTILLACIVLAGCVDRGAGPQGKKIEPSYVRENLLTAAPQDIAAMNIDLGGKVVYLGNKLVYQDGKDPKTPLAPGGTIRVMHYWHVKQPPGAQWRVFAFIRGGQGSADFQSLGKTDMQWGHPTKKWKAGQIIQDVQDIVLRPDWRSETATLYVGLVEDKGHQIGDRMMASGPNVVDRAIVARAIEVDLSKAPPPPGTLYLPRAAGAITIDGVATDPGWANAATSPELVTADGAPEPVGRATARMTWDEQNLYVFVQITDSDVYSPYTKQDEPLWKGDCVELFIDADGNRSGYVELQVNPNNAMFDSYFATTRAQPGDEAWNANMVTAVKVRGTADKAGDADQGWDVEIAIPLAAVKGRMEGMNVRLPPQVGDKWRLNVVRVDYRSGGGGPGVASWNRISYADFHALDRMLTVVFADPAGSIKPGDQMTPESGSAAGSAAPAQGSAAPAQGSAAPAQGSPAQGSAAPVTPAGSAPTTAPRAPAGSAAAPTTAPRAPAGSAAAPTTAPRAPAGSAAAPTTAPRAPAGSAAMPAPTIAPRATGSNAAPSPMIPVAPPAMRPPSPAPAGTGSATGTPRTP